jgi:uncharacterized RDD family membrane protein YckC
VQEQPGYELASVFERAIAFLLDFFLFVSAAVWSFFFLVKGGWVPENWQINAYLGLFLAFFLLYSAVFNAGGRRSLGKFLMSIRVVNKETGEPLGFVKSFIRSFGYILSFFTLFAGFALALLNANRRAVEDLVSGTVVVSTREKTTGEYTVISAFGTVLIGLAVFYVYYLVGIMPSAFQKMLVDGGQKQVDRIAMMQLEHKRLFGSYTNDLVRLGLISGDAVQFQRDIQKYLRRRGFAMGAAKDGFSIKALAKDTKETEVSIIIED